MVKLFRNYLVSIDTEVNPDNWVWSGTQWKKVSNKTPAKIEIGLPFTMDFDIDRNVMAGANTSRIVLYNLNEDSRKKIFKDQYSTNIYKGITIRAGYGMEDTPNLLPIVFKGNVKLAYSTRRGTEYTTEVQAYDGGFAFANADTNFSFNSGAKMNDTLDSIINTLPFVNKGAIGDFNFTIGRGNSYSGSTIETLQQLTNGNFFIDNEKAYCLKPNEYIGGEVLKITAETGLLETPLREETYIKIRTLFEPRIRVGQLVDLESSSNSEYNGLYKVLGFHHKGTISSAVGGDCSTEMTLYYGANASVLEKMK